MQDKPTSTELLEAIQDFLMKEIMPTAISIVVPTAYAQSTPVDIKKKVFLSQSR